MSVTSAVWGGSTVLKPLKLLKSTDYSPSPTATSRVTHVAQCVVFGAVMSDAAMLDAVLELDVWGKD